LLRPQENEESTPPPVTAKLIRKRKLLTADSEIEISKKEYSSHLKDTSNILKKVFKYINRELTISNAFYLVTLH